MPRLDVAVVGAGAAGIGMALALQKVPGLKFGVLEAGRVGESFRRWPAQTRFITPSFHSNPFGLADLNAVNEPSSPAIHAGAEHPSGPQYADYLAFIAKGHELPVACDCKVEAVAAVPGGGFILDTPRGRLQAGFLVWATGEFQFPDLAPFPGAQWCPHYARVADWSAFQARRYTVIGGYESGVDAAVNLVRSGRRVRLLARKSTWDPQGPHDPSLSLSPYSRQRLYEAVDTGRLEIVFGVDVIGVTRSEGGGFRIHAGDGRYWDERQAPILGTGFAKGGGARQIAELWDWDEDGRVMLSEADESTITPGLFLVGPQVRHDKRIYCFIYKFRQRFGMIAESIALCLGRDTSGLRGNVALGTALIPINMAAQLLLYPAYLYLFTRSSVEVQPGVIGGTLLQWFVAPLGAAVLAHYGLRALLGAERFARLLRRADQATPWVIALLVMEIFAANIPVILAHRGVFAWVLLAVFVFFAATFLLGEGLGRLGRLAYPDHALLTMSIAARNAPLMLAVTMAALPGQPLVYAALVIGMLVEFPHLTVLQRVLLGRHLHAVPAAGPASSGAMPPAA